MNYPQVLHMLKDFICSFAVSETKIQSESKNKNNTNRQKNPKTMGQELE